MGSAAEHPDGKVMRNDWISCCSASSPQVRQVYAGSLRYPTMTPNGFSFLGGGAGCVKGKPA